MAETFAPFWVVLKRGGEQDRFGIFDSHEKAMRSAENVRGGETAYVLEPVLGFEERCTVARIAPATPMPLPT